MLGNRFIKLFWHNKDQEKQDPAPEKNGTEGTEGDDRPVDRSQAENGSENRKQAGDRDGADDQDGDEEDKNRIPVKERLDLNLKPLEDASFKLQVSVIVSSLFR